MKDHNLLSTCCLCGQKYEGYGNSAYPIVENGYCCDVCNKTRVIPERLKRAMHNGMMKND